MARYLQRISLLPYSDSQIWTGWELEGWSGEVEGLLLADGIPEEELRTAYGVSEFQRIPPEYLSRRDFPPKA